MSNPEDQRRDWFLKYQSTLFEGSVAYTNLIIIAGYAGVFAIWSNTKEYICEDLARASAALLLFSILVFIGWEVAKMFVMAMNSKNIAKITQADAEKFEQLVSEYERSERVLIAKLSIIWPVVLFLTVPTAFAAGIIHLWALISAIF